MSDSQIKQSDDAAKLDAEKKSKAEEAKAEKAKAEMRKEIEAEIKAELKSEQSVEFNPALSGAELGRILSDEFGIDPSGKNKAAILKELKKNGAVPKKVTSLSLEDAQAEFSEAIENSVEQSKNSETVFITEPSVVTIVVGDDPHGDENDFTAKLNGKTYQMKRNTPVDVPYGLVADLMRQKILKPVERKVDGKTRSVIEPRMAYPYISIQNAAVKTRKREMPKALYEALKAKGELA